MSPLNPLALSVIIRSKVRSNKQSEMLLLMKGEPLETDLKGVRRVHSSRRTRSRFRIDK